MYNMNIIDNKGNTVQTYIGDTREHCADKAYIDGYLVEGMRAFYITRAAWDKGIRRIILNNLVEGYKFIVTDEPYNEEENEE